MSNTKANIMTEQITVGIVNTLKIDRESDHGLYLTDAIGESVLLPNLYVTDSMQPGDILDVFVYTDSEDRIVATTEMPLAKRDEFALMKVTDIAPFGAFVDWGLPKELLVPKKMQKNRLEIGKSYIIHVAYDPDTDRLVGDTRIGRYLSHDPKAMQDLEEVDMLIVARTPLGYKVIVENRYEGMLYHNEIFEKLTVGERRKGYLKKVREDGKLDLSLQPVGKAKEDASVQKVLEVLEREGPALPYTYKSDAEAIRERFGLSKKNFKRALTKLIDTGKIVLDETGIRIK